MLTTNPYHRPSFLILLSIIPAMPATNCKATGSGVALRSEPPSGSVTEPAGRGQRAQGGKDTVPALIEASNDDDAGVRTAAVTALANIRPVTKEAVAVFIQALTDEVVGVRRAAAEALGKTRPMVVRVLAGKLKDHDNRIAAHVETLQASDAEPRRATAEALGALGAQAKGAVPALIAVLLSRDEDEAVRSGAASALGAVGDKRGLPALIQALQDRQLTLRVVVAETIGRFGLEARKAVPALTALLAGTENNVVRSRAAVALGYIGAEARAAVPALAQTMHDTEFVIRMAAAVALARIGNAAVPALIEASQNRDISIRRLAIESLGNIRPVAEMALPRLTRALKDDAFRVRMTAAVALGKIGSPAVPALIHNLRDEDMNVRMAAAVALQYVRGQANEAMPALIGLLNSGDHDDVRVHAASALAHIGTDTQGAVVALTEALKDENVSVSKAAEGALRTIQSQTQNPDEPHGRVDD